jgi:hypothetical protein
MRYSFKCLRKNKSAFYMASLDLNKRTLLLPAESIHSNSMNIFLYTSRCPVPELGLSGSQRWEAGSQHTVSGPKAVFWYLFKALFTLRQKPSPCPEFFPGHLLNPSLGCMLKLSLAWSVIK